MTDRDFAPLSAACVKALSDKLYEKRKAAALEIEKMTKEFATVSNTVQIKKLLRVLGQEFAVSQNPHTRKGGLIGLAAMAIALGKETGSYMEELVKPILSCFLDTDSRVRFYACESLYNVVKVGRGAVLPLFNDVFDSLAKLVADPDQNVKNGAELLDRLLKDIVTESACFDVTGFVPLLRERIYTQNPFARQFIISWVMVLHAVPHLDLLGFLPDILDGLFTILEDPTQEIKKMCESLLNEFLRGVIENPNKVDFSSMINMLINHSQANDEQLRITAIAWISEFVILSGSEMLPYSAGILTAILPCMAFDDDIRRDMRESTRAVNANLMRLVVKDNEGLMELNSFVSVLKQNLSHNSIHTKLAVLRWILHLLTQLPTAVSSHTEDLFPALLGTLTDPSDEVVIVTVEALAQISNTQSHPDSLAGDTYFARFMRELLSLFRSDRLMQEERWAFIIRQLCILMNAEDIYRSLSENLMTERNAIFAGVMIETLNTLLMTASELFALRHQLKELKTEESCDLFCCLYKSWCHNPVATVSLCLLTQNYQHASSLIRHFGDLEVNVDFLTEIDQLVQLIESPIFAYLRLQLLEPDNCKPIMHTLSGLLMLLPQSEAFHTLRRRLECVANLRYCADTANGGTWKDKRQYVQQINFDDLNEHFLKVQEQHRVFLQESRLKSLAVASD